MTRQEDARAFREQYYNDQNQWGPGGRIPDDAYGEGKLAFLNHLTLKDMPPYPHASDAMDWRDGWRDAKKEYHQYAGDVKE